MNHSISTTCRQNEAVLPGGPLKAIYTGAALEFEDHFPLIYFGFLPYVDGFVIPTGSDHILELGVGPSYLPARPRMSLKLSHTLWNNLFPFHFENLDEPRTIAGRHSRPIEVKLRVVL